MKGFWNDEDGITVIDILALLFGTAAIASYIWFRRMDTNFADIVVGACLAAAGQKVGNIAFARRNKHISAEVEKKDG